MTDLIGLLERIANDHKLPCFIVDWACDLYDILGNSEATVRVHDLIALETWRLHGQDAGLSAVDALLARRR